MLKLEHLVAHVVTDLSSSFLVLELFTAAEFKDPLTLLVGTLLLPAPLVMLLYLGELHQVLTVVAFDFEQVNKLLEYM